LIHEQAVAMARANVLIGLIAAVTLGFVFGSEFGFSLFCACLWGALNIMLLAWLLSAVKPAQSPAERPPRWFIFILVCAKIPASYFILFWIFTRDYLSPAGLAAGLTTLPVVLFIYGLRSAKSNNEEGTV
jgi:hypothetical protein